MSNCNCDIYVTGCTCGYFAMEQAAKLSGKPISHTGEDDPKTAESAESTTVDTGQQGSTNVNVKGTMQAGGRQYSKVELPCETVAWKSYLADPGNLFWKSKVLEEFERHLTAHVTAQKGRP